MPTPALRWGRIVLGGLLAEAILFALVIPIALAGGGETTVTIVVAGSFLVFLPVARWLARPLPRPVLHGTLMGGAAAAIYMVLQVLGQQADPEAPAVPLIYYVGHLLKLAGGATGGWLACRSAGAAAGTEARVG